MWPALTVSGFFIFLFGIFLMFVTGLLGFMIFLAGPIMIIAGVILHEPTPPKPFDRSKKYCRFCMAEVDAKSSRCPECGFDE